MSDKPTSDLRRRMLEDMTVRRPGEKTQHDYITQVEPLTSLLDRSPGTGKAEELSERAAGQSQAAGPFAVRSTTMLLCRPHQLCQRRKIGPLLGEQLREVSGC